MQVGRILSLALALGLVTLFAGTLLSQDQNQPPPPPPLPPLQEGVEVEARGPVHEAFAAPDAPRPEASEIVPKQPPDPIEEMPPDQKPEGANVVWIPGYWDWDRGNDFVWVSGCWRDVPPNQVWVAGHWQQVQGGWQWAPGFWENAQQQQLEYVPPPPPSIDNGPSAPAPADTSTYVPGCWVYQQTRFLWRPGFWIAYQPDWVWAPAHYVWSPGGCVFLEGYWDHPLHARGLLFAPVRLAQAVRLRRDFVFEPQYCVQPDFLIGALFVGPTRHHYYFGDYFEERFVQRGFVPWVDYRTSKASYDPDFEHYRHAFARDKAWETNLRTLYAGRMRGDIPRPPTTLVQQNQVINNFTVNKIQNVTVNKTLNLTNIQNVRALAPISRASNLRVTALASLAHPHGTPAAKATASVPLPRNVIKLAPVAAPQRAAERQRVSQIREVAVQRQKAEAGLLATGNRPVKHTDPARPVKIDLPKLAARPPAVKPAPQPVVRTPPPRPVAPKHVEQPIPKHEPLRPSQPPGKMKPLPPPPKQTAVPARPQVITPHIPPAPAKQVMPAHATVPHAPPQHPPMPPKQATPPHPALPHPPHTPVAPHVQPAPPHPNPPPAPPKKKDGKG